MYAAKDRFPYILMSSKVTNQLFRLTGVLLAYRLFFTLKNVEIQLDQRYRTTEEIIVALKRYIHFSNILVFTMACFFLLLLSISVLIWLEIAGIKEFIVGGCVFCLLLYLLNLLVIGSFVRMAFNYLKFLKFQYKISQVKASSLIVIVTFWTVVALSKAMVFHTLTFIIKWFRQTPYDLLLQHNPILSLMERISHYFDCFQPFVLAIFVHLIISFFANV